MRWQAAEAHVCMPVQGVSAELQPKLVSSMAYAAGRYGHVIFPENTHQPALDLAQKLLDGVGQGWAGKVFFSDNGYDSSCSHPI